MKFFATFASLLLLATSINALAHHHSSKHHHAKSLFQSRAAGDSCTWKCTDQNGVEVGSDVVQTGSWAIDIVGGATSAVTLSFFYDAALNVFIIFNRQINVAVVFLANSGVYAVINLNTLVALVIAIQSQWALVVDISASLATAFATNMQTAINLSAQLITTYSSQVTSVLITLNSNAFYLGGLISSLALGSISYAVVFALKASLQAKVQLSFGALLAASAARLTVGSVYSASYGTLNILVGVFGTIHGLQQGFLSVVAYLALNAGGFVSANVSVAFSLIYRISVFVGGFINGTIYEVRLQTGAVLVFLSVSGSALFTVLASGAIQVGSTIVGAIGGAIQAAGTVLSNINLNAGISVNFGFSGGIAAAGGGAVSG